MPACTKNNNIKFNLWFAAWSEFNNEMLLQFISEAEGAY